MAEKFCPQCGSKVDGTAKFCPECGTPIGTAMSKPPKSTGTSTAPKKSMRDLIIVVGVLAVTAAAYLIYYFNTDHISPAPPSSQQSSDQPAMGEETQNPHADGNISMAVLDSLPNDYNSLIQMAYHYHDQGSQTGVAQNFAIAAEIYRRALKIDSSDQNVRVDYGAVLHGMGLPQRAIEEFVSVLKINPKHGVANFNMGVVYQSLSQPDSSRVYFKRYLEIEPNGAASQAARDFLKQLGG